MHCQALSFEHHVLSHITYFLFYLCFHLYTGANNSSFYLGSTSKTFAFCIDGKPNVFKLGTSPDGDAGYTVRTTKAPVPKSTGTC